MSKIDFRTGALLGRLGGMVGATWKGIDYVRKHVIPFNPKSAGQTGTRTVFAALVAMGRRINSTILKLHVWPKPKKMSPFNWFLSINQPLLDAGVYTIADVIASKGSLFVPPNVVLTAGAADDSVLVEWDDDLEGEAATDDKIIIIIYNATTDSYAFDSSVTRTTGTKAIAIGETSADVIHAWLFATQGDTIVSDSAYDTDNVT